MAATAGVEVGEMEGERPWAVAAAACELAMGWVRASCVWGSAAALTLAMDSKVVRG